MRGAAWRFTRTVLVAVDALAASTAIAGGAALLTGIEGDRFPLRMLDGTPFSTYTIPGLLLAGVVGGSAAVALLTTVHAPAVGGWASVVAGLVMLGWIGGEIALLRQFTWIEGVYFGVGLSMALLGLDLCEG